MTAPATDRPATTTLTAPDATTDDRPPPAGDPARPTDDLAHITRKLNERLELGDLSHDDELYTQYMAAVRSRQIQGGVTDEDRS